MMAHDPFEVVGQVRDLESELDFYLQRAGFRIEAVFPADDPSTAIVSSGGMRIRLVRGDADHPLRLRQTVRGGSPRCLHSPGGSTIEIEPPDDAIVVPAGDPSLVVTHAGATSSWVTGRAGMRYRDLLPGRWGGRFIASHIHIPDGGPVPDYVHYHRIRFQMIVVRSGWVEVVYEDQGPPFVMHAGDAVLQPPEIRHRVLTSSPDLEVIEIGCPAEHLTLADHDLDLPTPDLRPDRDFGGQRFARSVLADRPTAPWRCDGYTARDTGFGAATDGLVGARIVEPDAPSSDAVFDGAAEFSMLVVLDGSVDIAPDRRAAVALTAGDSVAVPPGGVIGLRRPSPDLRLLDVTAPA